MMTGFLKGGYIQLKSEGEASTLRNRGYFIKRIRGDYFLDIISGAYLLRKSKLEIRQQDATMDFNTLYHFLTFRQKMILSTFEHLRNIGIKCQIRSENVYLGKRKVTIFHYSNQINFNDLDSGILSIVDRDFESLLYQVKRKRLLKGKNLNDPVKFLEEVSRKFIIKSGAKFGAEYRLYSGKSKHSKVLLNLKGFDDANSLIAKARVSHSVKKELLYCFPHKEGVKCLSFKWVH